MPQRTIRNETDGTFAFNGSWSTTASNALWGSLPAGAGVVKYSNTAGAYLLITLPANHGFDGGRMIGYGTSIGTTNAAIQVDGEVVQAAWNQKFGSSASAYYNMPRIKSWPFKLLPAKPGSATQVIRVDIGTDGGTTYIDGMELWQAAARVPGLLVSAGHSMESAVIDSNTLGPASYRHSALFATHLGATKYDGVSAWTDRNLAIPSSNLTNGSNNSGNSGGTGASSAYSQFANQRPWPVAADVAVPTPYWMQMEAGDTWPNPAPYITASTLVGAVGTSAGVNAAYYAGVAQWWAQKFHYGIFFHNVNDLGISFLYDNPADGVVDNAASALKQVQTLASSATLTGGTFTITGPDANGVARTTLATSAFTDLPTVQSRLAGATGGAIDFTASGTPASGQFFTGVNTMTFTANQFKAQPSNLSITPTGLTGGTLTMAAPNPAGRNKDAAGTDYELNCFIQRFRDALGEAAIGITPSPRIAIIGYPNVANGGPQASGLNQTPATLNMIAKYDAAMRAVLDEPWILAVTGGNPFYFVPIVAAETGKAVSVSNSDNHPSALGHQVIFEEIRRMHELQDSHFIYPSSSVRVA